MKNKAPTEKKCITFHEKRISDGPTTAISHKLFQTIESNSKKQHQRKKKRKVRTKKKRNNEMEKLNWQQKKKLAREWQANVFV